MDAVQNLGTSSLAKGLWFARFLAPSLLYNLLMSYERTLTNYDLSELVQEMRKSLSGIQLMDRPFRVRSIQNLRRELSNKISMAKMTEEKRSYYIHQIAYARELEELSELLTELNHISN